MDSGGLKLSRLCCTTDGASFSSGGWPGSCDTWICPGRCSPCLDADELSSAEEEKQHKREIPPLLFEIAASEMSRPSKSC